MSPIVQPAGSVPELASGTALPRWRDLLDRAAAFTGLVVLSPLLAGAAVAVRCESGGPVLFRQKRVGRGGALFELLKFRTMLSGVQGTRVTAAGDRRVTRVGRWLRKWKIDELPQLWNVCRGDMSLVGPRPEVPAFVDQADPVWKALLEVRPGLTDLATLACRAEEDMLASAPDTERYYREVLLPAKLELSLVSIRKRSLCFDFKLLALTAWHTVARQRPDLGRLCR